MPPGSQLSPVDVQTLPQTATLTSLGSSGSAVSRTSTRDQLTRKRTKTAIVRPPQCDEDSDDADLAPVRIIPPAGRKTTAAKPRMTAMTGGKSGATTTSGRVTRTAARLSRGSSCPPKYLAPPKRKSASPNTTQSTGMTRPSAGKAPTSPRASSNSGRVVARGSHSINKEDGYFCDEDNGFCGCCYGLAPNLRDTPLR